MTWVIWPIGLVVAAVLAWLLILAGRRSRALAGTVLIALLAALAGVWVAGNRLMASGWHDIDGWVDCHGHCNAWHAVGGVLFWWPPLIAFLLVLVFLEEVVRRGSDRPSSRPRTS